MAAPMDYSLCTRTVTLYRLLDTGVDRQELPNCYLEAKTRHTADTYGTRMERPFLLIIPNTGQISVLPGDRVYDGVGPEIGPQRWASFIPANEPRLMQVQYVQPCYFGDTLCHTEAGRKSTALAR